MGAVTCSKKPFLFTLTANGRYRYLKIEEKDMRSIAFTSHHGLNCFVGMPFGEKNAPETFQQTTNVILATIKWKYALVCLESMNFLKTLEGHTEHVRQVLGLLERAGVTVDLK